jgi:DNA repair protein RadA/Sms
VSKAKIKIVYRCEVCETESPQYLGRCPGCDSWNTLQEKKTEIIKSGQASPSSQQRFSLDGELPPQLLKDIALTDVVTRYSSGYPELDRVLGGGFIPGAYFLFGGDPGIGKSTLMLQVAQKVSQAGRTVLYVAGEESPHQIKMRAERLEVIGQRILIYPETNIHKIQDEIQASRPDMVIIDSIQSVYDPNLSGTPGNASQLKECAGQLMGIAKALNVTILLVGHVTKEGTVSGPKLLEHTVDGVLYFEGEKFRNLRILRAVKNRFGNTNEIGVFEIGEDGLAEVSNPSELFLSENSYQNQPGSVIVATMEGNRPLLVELQALVGLSTYASPRRVANGVDLSRLHQIVAVLERRLGLDFSKQDIYVNVVGGLRIQEPAADLGIALALVSSHYEVALKPKSVISGEIGLTGEVRPISHHDARVTEAQKLGFEKIVLPKTRKPQDKFEAASGIEAIEIRSLMEALSQCLDRNASLDARSMEEHADGEWMPCP